MIALFDCFIYIVVDFVVMFSNLLSYDVLWVFSSTQNDQLAGCYHCFMHQILKFECADLRPFVSVFLSYFSCNEKLQYTTIQTFGIRKKERNKEFKHFI